MWEGLLRDGSEDIPAISLPLINRLCLGDTTDCEFDDGEHTRYGLIDWKLIWESVLDSDDDGNWEEQLRKAVKKEKQRESTKPPPARQSGNTTYGNR